jgi:hypothetical protein
LITWSAWPWVLAVNVTSGNINNEVHMQEMEARAFLHKQSNGIQENSHGYSNSQTKHDASTMIPNAERNIDNNSSRLEEKQNTNSREIDVRTSMDLQKMKEYVKDMDKNESK